MISVIHFLEEGTGKQKGDSVCWHDSNIIEAFTSAMQETDIFCLRARTSRRGEGIAHVFEKQYCVERIIQ